jgi:SnoaL-like domain
MSAPALDRFRAAFLRNVEAMNRGDMETAFGWVPPSFEWQPLPELAVPAISDLPRVMRGPEEVQSFFRMLFEDWAWQVEPVKFEQEEDAIVVLMAGSWTGPHTGIEAGIQFTQTWEFGADGAPTRVLERVERAELEGLGRPES